MTTSVPGQKVSVQFDRRELAEIKREAERQDRAPSWLLRVAWKIAKDRVAQLRPTREGT